MNRTLFGGAGTYRDGDPVRKVAARLREDAPSEGFVPLVQILDRMGVRALRILRAFLATQFLPYNQAVVVHVVEQGGGVVGIGG